MRKLEDLSFNDKRTSFANPQDKERFYERLYQESLKQIKPNTDYMRPSASEKSLSRTRDEIV